MGKELSARIQTSILNAAEKKALVWLAERQPRWVTSDLLTYLGVLGAVVCAVGCILSNINVNYLWISSLGLVINWYGDSLDGTLARVRHTQRPLYGFFIDHTLDAITICIMCVGFGLSPAFHNNWNTDSEAADPQRYLHRNPGIPSRDPPSERSSLPG